MASLHVCLFLDAPFRQWLERLPSTVFAIGASTFRAGCLLFWVSNVCLLYYLSSFFLLVALDALLFSQYVTHHCFQKARLLSFIYSIQRCVPFSICPVHCLTEQKQNRAHHQTL